MCVYAFVSFGAEYSEKENDQETFDFLPGVDCFV